MEAQQKLRLLRYLNINSTWRTEYTVILPHEFLSKPGITRGKADLQKKLSLNKINSLFVKWNAPPCCIVGIGSRLKSTL
jgi:hypothetical protein